MDYRKIGDEQIRSMFNHLVECVQKDNELPEDIAAVAPRELFFAERFMLAQWNRWLNTNGRPHENLHKVLEKPGIVVSLRYVDDEFHCTVRNELNSFHMAEKKSINLDDAIDDAVSQAVEMIQPA